MFVDASAIVAMIAHEPGHAELAKALEGATSPRTTSGIAILEAVMALRRIGDVGVPGAEAIVRRFLDEADIVVVAITDLETRGAFAAYGRYGKGQDHPAQLNMGDCFAYACARAHDVPLLFVGNDFSQTDIQSAMS
ncbi:type II toxin-antitoxin system VapC family toxin [Methylobacterium brachythecii]|uniref:Ribonuclease VapC n=1 Tax=Methylobacterium brachythecii TaxID=1176177 RepID=A0A7W6AN31_9HYPH|nr:type II toxin-antitoxin system VapC family toxin [Methylobacterium brachythecii]MBB3904259.1 ribonuclease VapC [Methylobacterium brachythecii]GLS45079.1 ribonuclease VapC [Methylobacterium brachythecii]